MNKKGFSLIEILLVFFVLVLIFLLAIPIVIGIINKSKLNSYKVSSTNVLEAIEYYLTQNQDFKIPSSGIDINNIDKSILKNNDFDEGIIIKNEKEQLEITYLKKDNYCSKGTKGNINVSNKGCGALDESKPTDAYIFFKTSDDKSITVVAQGYDPNSKIISYELSVDEGKYIKNDDPSYNVFNVNINDSLEHTFKVRITNEAGLKIESDKKVFKKEYTFTCDINTDIDCPKNKDYLYSDDFSNWSKDSNLNLLENKDYYINTKNGYHLISINNFSTLLKSSTPVLDDNMIPVIYNSETKKWVKANPNMKYYDYENKLWANAVLVRKNKDENDNNSKDRSYYLSDEAIYEGIYEKDILAFYVWIPKYSYKLWNVNGNNNDIVEIEIGFENNMNTNTGQLPINGNWHIHQAFSYNENINGFWISKYLMSADIDSSCYAFRNKDNCNIDSYNIYSLPSTNKLSNIDLINADSLTTKMNLKNNIYGLSENTQLHVPTNLEYGSVLYLAASKYGSLANNISSTGNETGVYFDLNSNEMVMANYFEKTGKLKIETWPKYIDYYRGITNKSRILGDATLETDKWYDNKNSFINGEEPFMVRGGSNIFAYNSYNGNISDKNYFRTILYIDKTLQ